jgi:predicted lipoprotein
VTSVRRATIVRFLLSVVAPLVLLAILRPWTVRPLESEAPAVFDAATFASSAWPRLVAESTVSAVNVSDIVAAPGAPSSPARFVKGIGVVTTIDRRSRAGIMLVRVVGPPPNQPVVAMQIGPVIRGTALRDASGFIHFSDFTNQSEYAAAANALNESALRLVIAPMELETLTGRLVSFVGAVGKSATRDDGAIEMVPVRIGVSGGGAQ